MIPPLTKGRSWILPRIHARVNMREKRVTTEPCAVTAVTASRPCFSRHFRRRLRNSSPSAVDLGYRRLTNSVFTSPLAEMECMAKPRGAVNE